ncbi:MipA/OmpV family protein [Thalassotalea agarivorans]|uniref:Outer membrane protein n=2 Tax=Thalassotalea agarivorans TaxID=349064 RepID=A0A1I0H3G6_THASX|nr:MipA/OmpV family protein [Thalassotalea agarivorans]SET78133.1 outer membrane protein [Thalassotalea agarivorans]
MLAFSQAHASAPVEKDRIVNVGEWMFGASLGVGAFANPLHYEEDIPLYILPDIRYYGEKFSLENLNLSYALIEKPNWVVEVIGQQNIDGIYFPGNGRRAIAAMSGSALVAPFGPDGDIVSIPQKPIHRSLSYLAGLEVRRYGTIDWLASIAHDISNVHHGYEVNLRAQYGFSLYNLLGEVEIGAVYKSDKLNNYYYSVEHTIVAANLYQAAAGTNVNASITLSYPLAETWYLVSALKYEHLSSQITDSPMVQDDNTLAYFTGVKYIY